MLRSSGVSLTDLYRIYTQIGDAAYIKIYPFSESFGDGKIYNVNVSSEENNQYIGKAYKQAKVFALASMKPFRAEFLKKK